MYREEEKYKAIHFDLNVQKLKENYSLNNPNKAYKDISLFFERNNFEHRQYSGYHSKQKMFDPDIFDLIFEMSYSFSWLVNSINKFDVTNIGKYYDFTPFINRMK